jgi:hypothetical protein
MLAFLTLGTVHAQPPDFDHWEGMWIEFKVMDKGVNVDNSGSGRHTWKDVQYWNIVWWNPDGVSPHFLPWFDMVVYRLNYGVDPPQWYASALFFYYLGGGEFTPAFYALVDVPGIFGMGLGVTAKVKEKGGELKSVRFKTCGSFVWQELDDGSSTMVGTRTMKGKMVPASKVPVPPDL